jgi:hypothetical protein
MNYNFLKSCWRLSALVMSLVCALGGLRLQASALCVADALSTLKKTDPVLMRALRKQTPAVLPFLEHKHQRIGKRLGSLAARAVIGYAAVVGFAIANDQVTTRVLKEYFSEGFHKNNMQIFAPRLYEWLAKKDSATWWATVWGCIAGNQIAQFAGPLFALVSAVGNLPPVPPKMAAYMAAGVLGLTAISTFAGYKHAGNFWSLVNGKPHQLNSLDYTQRQGYINNHLEKFGCDLDNATMQSHASRERYYRVHAAHGMLYLSGLSAMLGMLIYMLGWRIYKYKRYRKERARALDIVRHVSITGHNEKALQALIGVLAEKAKE